MKQKECINKATFNIISKEKKKNAKDNHKPNFLIRPEAKQFKPRRLKQKPQTEAIIIEIETHQPMKQDQHRNSCNRRKATVVQSGAVARQNDGIIGYTHDAEDQEDHDRAKAPQGGAELENIPSHHSSGSMHARHPKNEFQKTNTQFFLKIQTLFLVSDAS